jgi:ABC-type phosphate transport system auxiliary subunit
MHKDTIKTVAIGLLPVLLSIIGYLFQESMTLKSKISTLEQKMSILVDMDNQIIPSPSNSIERLRLKEEMLQKNVDLDKRLSIIEHHVFKMLGNKH